MLEDGNIEPVFTQLKSTYKDKMETLAHAYNQCLFYQTEFHPIQLKAPCACIMSRERKSRCKSGMLNVSCDKLARLY